MTKQQKKNISIADKLEILKYLKEHESTHEAVTKHFDVSVGAVQNVVRDEYKLLEAARNNTNLNSCRIKAESRVNTRVFQWFCDNRARGLPISDALLKEVAIDYSREEGKPNFKASNGWLEAFKTRYNINRELVNG